MDTNNEHEVLGTGSQRAMTEVLADAIRVLTEAARLRRPALTKDADGAWREHPTHTRQADWAEFVTQALAGAAANIGSVDAALAGRPGSWEADAVHNLLHSTVGYDEQYLFGHRTEPLRVVVDVEQILDDLDITLLYDDAEAALDKMQDDALAAFDYTPYYWTYTRDDTGEWAADDPEAPPWSIEAWRASVAATAPLDADKIDELEQCALKDPAARSASIVKSPESARAITQLAEQEDAIAADYRAQLDALAAQRIREWATYAEAFAANVRREAARRYPEVSLQIELHTNPSEPGVAEDLGLDGLPEARLIEYATLHTPLPGSGIPPKDYPRDISIHDAETAAERLPHLRLAPVVAQDVPTSGLDDRESDSDEREGR